MYFSSQKVGALILCAILSGCCSPAKVSASIAETGETFTGTAQGTGPTPERVLDGKLELLSNHGVKCHGTYHWRVFLDAGKAEFRTGSLTCDDGRSGKFTYDDSSRKITAKGHLDGKAIVLEYDEASGDCKIGFFHEIALM